MTREHGKFSNRKKRPAEPDPVLETPSFAKISALLGGQPAPTPDPPLTREQMIAAIKAAKK